MTSNELWQRYADIWSTTPDKRLPELQICLHSECSYCDPNGVVVGQGALHEYMEGFQQYAPGARFQITSVAEHHGRTMSEWELRGSDGLVLQTGRSFATCDEQGRLQHITGFFDPQPKVKQNGI